MLIFFLSKPVLTCAVVHSSTCVMLKFEVWESTQCALIEEHVLIRLNMVVLSNDATYL